MNLASRCVLLTVCGPKTLEVLKTTGLAAVLKQGRNTKTRTQCLGLKIGQWYVVKRTSSLGKCGDGSAVNFLVDEGVAGQVWAAIIKAGRCPSDRKRWTP